jgi:hypothetical protein
MPLWLGRPQMATALCVDVAAVSGAMMRECGRLHIFTVIEGRLYYKPQFRGCLGVRPGRPRRGNCGEPEDSPSLGLSAFSDSEHGTIKLRARTEFICRARGLDRSRAIVFQSHCRGSRAW